MIVDNHRHFYIYEPVELRTGQLAVPMFFFKSNDKILAKCLPALIQNDLSDPDRFNIVIPEEPPFDSEEFYTFDVVDFAKTFEEITLDHEVYLSPLCGPNMYRESQVLWVVIISFGSPIVLARLCRT